jgi:hypothetical protein
MESIRQRDDRLATTRRCAWCKRVLVQGEWVRGRRAGDDGPVGTHPAPHTICDECSEALRRTVAP